jgi:flagellar biosynthetic protein FlhB
VAERPESARTEPATPRRLAEARRQGQVAVSRSLSGAFGLAAAFFVLLLSAGTGTGRLVGYVRAALADATRGASARDALAVGLGQGAALLALPLGLALVATVAAGLAQTGGLFTVTPLRLDPARLRGRLFSGPALLEAGKGVLEAAILLGLAALTVLPLARPLASLTGASAARVLLAAGVVGAALAWRLVAAAVAFGAVDLVWQRHRHRQTLRMTRAEVERERRQHEGDPRLRAERQRLHQAALEQHLPSDVRQASFVIAGAQRAIALRHDEAGAPLVVARGEGRVAAQVLELARAAGLPIFTDEALAAALAVLETGQEIPPAIYEPVARIVQVMLEGSRR